MGRFVGFKCKFCRYEESNIGVGRGKNEFPFLRLYICNHCHTIGSTWINENKIPRCSQCYDDALIMLSDDTHRVICPKCGEAGMITPGEGNWE